MESRESPNSTNAAEQYLQELPSFVLDLGQDEGNEAPEEEGYAPATGVRKRKLIWFSSTLFPLITALCGPIFVIHAVAAIVSTPWANLTRQTLWLGSAASVSLLCGLVAHSVHMLDLGDYIRYATAFPLTIALWGMSSIVMILPLPGSINPPSNSTEKWAFPHASMACGLSGAIVVLLIWSALGATVFRAYPAKLNQLTPPQRDFVLQSLFFLVYLTLGAVIFLAIESWAFTESLFALCVSLFTIGLPTELETSAAATLNIFYSAGGLFILGVIASSIRSVVIERDSLRSTRESLETSRSAWKLGDKGFFGGGKTPPIEASGFLERWSEAEFQAMREIEDRVSYQRKWSGFTVSVVVFSVVLFGGAAVFAACEMNESDPEGFDYGTWLYFSAASVLTVGASANAQPASDLGKAFFVSWVLVVFPIVVVLLTTMENTVVYSTKRFTLFATIGHALLPIDSEGKSPRTTVPSRLGSTSPTAAINSSPWIESRRNPVTTIAVATLHSFSSRCPDEIDVHSTAEIEETQEETTARLPLAIAATSPNIASATTAIETPTFPATTVAKTKLMTSEAVLEGELAAYTKWIQRDVHNQVAQYEWEQWHEIMLLLEEVVQARGRESADESDSIPSAAAEAVADVTKEATFTWIADDGPLLFDGTEVQWLLQRVLKLQGMYESDNQVDGLVAESGTEERV